MASSVASAISLPNWYYSAPSFCRSDLNREGAKRKRRRTELLLRLNFASSRLRGSTLSVDGELAL
jgi:hypothetical protein